MLVSQLGEEFECAICCDSIDKYKPGVVIITCGGLADFEHLFCEDCDKRFEKQDPYKRQIKYRFTFPFVDNKAAINFMAKCKKFVFNKDDEEKQRTMVNAIQHIKVDNNGYQDLTFDFDLRL